jgi:hypothetical protein
LTIPVIWPELRRSKGIYFQKNCNDMDFILFDTSWLLFLTFSKAQINTLLSIC